MSSAAPNTHGIGDDALESVLARPPLERRDDVCIYVEQSDDYCGNFGLQWNRFRTIQIDSLSGKSESHDRFYRETEWAPADLAGKTLLDLGCGAGRFAEVALEAGARVVAVDLSHAIFACRETVARFPKDRYLLLQASVFDLPFRAGVFDGVYSLGVLQHTPDPLRAIECLVPPLKPGGRLATWIYETSGRQSLRAMFPKYLIRRLVARRWTDSQKLVLAKTLTALGFPLGWALSWLGRPGQVLSAMLPYAARHHHARRDLRRQWDYCVMDTFDWYGPTYDLPQTESDVRRTMEREGLISVHRTSAVGMAIVGEKPAQPLTATLPPAPTHASNA
jgi:2-polyprenyl-3-methyl-5-hydroxy-6-metoxy-1,4-benzoquinol methylase